MKYNLLFTTNIILLILASSGIVASFVFGKYLVSAIFVLILIIAIYHLNKINKQGIRDINKLINAITFSEFNVSFKYAEEKGFFPKLATKMKNTIQIFNERTQQNAAEFNFYDNLLRIIDTAIIVINHKKQVQWINKSALNIMGKHPKKVVDFEDISPGLPDILENLVPKEVKTISLQSNANEYKLAATVVLFTSRGEELKLVSLKNIHTVLEDNETEAWKKLIRVLTHEMMNSITPILSLAETFSGEESTDMMKKAMQTIYRRSAGLVQFVGNYQKLTRIPSPVFVTFGISEMMEDVSSLLKAQSIKFTYSIEPKNLLLNADKSQIEQVLINLIKNAWEACLNVDAPNVEVKISKNEYNHPRIIVSDNGQGILSNVVDKIFIPFFTTKQQGSGIGLSICRQIINAHGGSISVNSEPEKGSTFIIKL